MTPQFTAKRIGYKRYKYRGFEIQGYNYYEPDQSPVWEAYDADGSGFAHSKTLKQCKFWIDYEIEKQTTNR